jgi:translation initiation factor 1
MSDTYSKTVYSTERNVCRKCGQDPCAGRPAAAPKGGPVRVGRETKGRKGAGVTVVTGLGMTPEELKGLLSSCKKRLGCGGTVRNGALEFQGEHRDALVAHLASLGIAAKRSGS